MWHLGVHRNRRTELIIFDCDAVLIDSEIIAATALSAALAEDGICILEFPGFRGQQGLMSFNFCFVRNRTHPV